MNAKAVNGGPSKVKRRKRPKSNSKKKMEEEKTNDMKKEGKTKVKPKLRREWKKDDFLIIEVKSGTSFADVLRKLKVEPVQGRC